MNQTERLKGRVVSLIASIVSWLSTSVFRSGMSGGPFFALATPEKLSALDSFLKDRFAILTRNRLKRFIGWDESRVLVLLSRARWLVVVARTFLLFGLGTVAGKMPRLIAVKTHSSFLGRAGGTGFGLLHEHVNCRLKEIGTDTAGIEVGWWCFRILN
jgi:hypothetical protein